MSLISLGEASKFTEIPDSTLRDYINKEKLEKYKDEKGFICVDKKQVLKLNPTVISLYNFKGGVGKSSISIMLTDYYDFKNEKVLIIDFDPQANTTRTFFSSKELQDENNNYSSTLYDYFIDKKHLRDVVKTYNKNIDVLPARLEMMEKSNISHFDLMELRDDFFDIFKKYTMVIIDCPPALNSFTTLGLLLCNYILIPFIPEPFSAEGVTSLLKSMKKVTQFNNDFCDFRIIFSRTKNQKIVLHEIFMESISKILESNLLKNKIPEAILIAARGISRTNIFTEKDNAVEKIKDTFDELENFIFNLREFK
ncbi:MAG TPA: hypothetical protein DC057_16315 [Spirochaetia bacterium]|nr:hypothetical protein [Spirochaetia bacterium]